MPAAARPRDGEGARPIGSDGDDLRAVRRIGAGVDQRLEVGPGPGHEDDETSWRRASETPSTALDIGWAWFTIASRRLAPR